MLVELEAKLSWKEMGELLNINCFINNPRLKSSLKFLRTNPWARNKVEILYLKTFHSKHPEATKIIRKAVVRKRNEATQSAANNRNTNNQKPHSSNSSNKKSNADENAFVWPTIKK